SNSIDSFIISTCRAATKLVKLTRSFQWASEHFDELSVAFDDLTRLHPLSWVRVEVNWKHVMETESFDLNELALVSHDTKNYRSAIALVVDTDHLLRAIKC